MADDTGFKIERLMTTPPPRARKMMQRAGWPASPDVCAFVRSMAAHAQSQRSIASYLGKSLSAFEAALGANKGENPLRLAFEAGKAEWEQEKIDKWNQLDPTDPKQMIGAIFFMKAQAGWRDKPDVTNVDGPRINITLPGSYSEEAYMKKIGQVVEVSPGGEQKQLGGVKIGDMKDVQVGADGLLPTLGPGAKSS